MRHLILPLLLAILPPPPARGQTPYFPLQPAWQSQALGKYGTGLGVADLNGDWWPDLVVANGNDMRRQRLEVYYNRAGTFPTQPDWESADIDYLGHLALGDVNGDGWIDAAVSVFLGAAGFSAKGHVKLYLNDGKGTLGKNPAWRTTDSFYSFGCALGDADADGDLDLLVATGEGYQNPPDLNRLYLNRQGSLSGTPDWKSAVQDHSMGGLFADVNADGWLDLVFAGWKSPSTVYHNRGGGTFPTTPDWKNSDNSTSIMAAAGDLDGDGLPELAFADNSQLGGSGRIKYYANSAAGLGRTAAWVSNTVRYGSCVALADFDQDGLLDIAGGGWWDKVTIYRNTGKGFAATPSWSSGTSSVLEKLVLRDTAFQGLYLHDELFFGDGKRRVFTLRSIPVERIYAVRVDGRFLAAGQWCADDCTGWVSLAKAPQKHVRVYTVASHNPDLVASNWDSGKGNYLFRRAPGVVMDPVYVLDWYFDPATGMWPYVGLARNLHQAPFQGTIEARCLDPDGRQVRLSAMKVNLAPGGLDLFFGWFPVDWNLRQGLYTIRLRALTGGMVTGVHEHPIELLLP